MYEICNLYYNRILQRHEYAYGIIQRICQMDKLIVQELCESRGGRPGLAVLTSLLVSVDVKLY